MSQSGSHQQSARLRYRDWRIGLGMFCIIGELLTTHALIKLALLGFAAIVLLWAVQRTGFHLTRSDLLLAGTVLFGITYLISPYWTLTTLPDGIGGAITLVGLVILGVLWCLCFARQVAQPARPPLSIPCSAIAVLLILAFVSQGLFAPLEWRGDEDAHLLRLWTLKDAWRVMPLAWSLPLGFVLCLTAVWNPGGRLNLSLRWVMVVGSLAVVTWAMGRTNDAGQLDDMLRRYPAGILWLHAALTWSVRGWERALSTGSELARLLPAVSVMGLALWWLARSDGIDRESTKAGLFLKLIIALSLTTIPAIQCYTASIYLELPLILLMVWMCCDADRLLDAHLHNHAVGPAWIALAIIPFLKETAIVFCVAVMGYAAWVGLVELAKRRIGWRALLWRYLRLGVVLLLPMVIYIYFREQGPAVRSPYGFHLPNFTEPALYRILVTSLWEQCGLLLVFSAIGLIHAWRRRPRQAVFCLIVLIGYFLFFYGSASKRVLVSGVSLPGYLGYARFTLYMVPPLLALAWHGIVLLSKRRRALIGAALAVWLAGNIWMSPLRLDGTRIAGWGDHLIDTQGHHYPYPQLYGWFAETLGEQQASVAVVGRRYRYDIGDSMYVRRFGLNLDITSYPIDGFAKLQVHEPLMSLPELEQEFQKAARLEPNYIVIHQPAWGPQWHDPPTLGRYEFAEKFSRAGHDLIIYRRQIRQEARAECRLDDPAYC